MVGDFQGKSPHHFAANKIKVHGGFESYQRSQEGPQHPPATLRVRMSLVVAEHMQTWLRSSSIKILPKMFPLQKKEHNYLIGSLTYFISRSLNVS